MSDLKMKARIALIAAGCLVLAGPLLFGCGGDSAYKPPPLDDPPPGLQHKDDILFNLELAYNERNFMQYDKLLDENFTFILSEAQYNAGEVDVPQWDRDVEVSKTTQIFSPNLPGDKRVISLDLNLDYPAETGRSRLQTRTIQVSRGTSRQLVTISS